MIELNEIADALEDCTRAQNNIKAKQEVLRGLFQKCGDDAKATETLLRVLLPSEDRTHVYGFKTRRMLRLFADASDAAAAKKLLLDWQPNPVQMDDKNTIGCYPEFAIAKACVVNQHARPPGRMTMAQLMKACDALTEAYRHPQAPQAQIIKRDLFSVAGGQPFAVWVLVARLLLRSVTMSAGPATVFGALHASSAPLYEMQRDLACVALKPETRQIVCGNFLARPPRR
jgi:hypothetical protein